MPKRPFQTLNLVTNRCTQHRLTLDETFTVLAQHRELHREVIPVQNVSRLGTHLELELPQRVVTIREKGNGLVHLYVLRMQHLVQTALGLRIEGLYKAKAL